MRYYEDTESERFSSQTAACNDTLVLPSVEERVGFLSASLEVYLLNSLNRRELKN